MSNFGENHKIDSQSYRKSAQLYTAITQRTRCFSSNIEEINEILQSAGDVNYQFPSDSYLKIYQPELIGSTILHFTMSQNSGGLDDIIELLLKYGADCTITNRTGSSSLHQVIETFCEKNKNSWKWKSKFLNENTSKALSMQVKSLNATNPLSSDKISHLHIACITNHQEAVTFFLENGSIVDQAVSTSACYFPGYTPLHFAVRFCAVEVVETLLNYNADVNIQDARGMTPMHIAIERRIEILDLLNEGELLYKDGDLSRDMRIYGEIIKKLLQKSSFVDCIGLTRIHVACVIRDLSLVKKYLEQADHLNHSVNLNSPVWPGYTALHFAALFDAEIVKFLLKHGAKITVKDTKGITPFDICLESYSLEQIYSVLSSDPIRKNILFSDFQTSLLDIIEDMNESNSKVDAKNMNIFIPFDSSLWPGYTPLHIAVVFADRVKYRANYRYEDDELSNDPPYKLFEPRFRIKSKYLAGGVNLTAKDANGSTPLHLAFRLQKPGVITELLKYNSIKNSVDNDNLSHLHIAAAEDDVYLLTKLLQNGADVDLQIHSTYKILKTYSYDEDSLIYYVPEGSTALHIAAAKNNYKTIKVLLEYGANIYVKDVNGMTPIHRQIMSEKSLDKILQYRCEFGTKEMINSPNLKNCIDNSCNLSHLHVAAFLGQEEAVKKLLKLGADINAVIKSVDPSNETLMFLASYAGFTPFLFALKNNNFDVCKVLINEGADVFGQSKDIPLLYQKLVSNEFFSMLEEDEFLREKMFERTGLTMHHLACQNLGYQYENFNPWCRVTDINARSHQFSPLWPRCTPLDVLIFNLGKYCKEFEETESEESKDHWWIDTLVESEFLERGADVTVVNGLNTTPLLEVDRLNRAFKEEKNYCNTNDEEDDDYYDYDRYHLVEYRSKSSCKKRKVKCIWNKSTREEDEKVSYSRLLNILMNGHKDFNVNPVNAKGISHFHVACLYKLYDVARKFLEHNADTNAAVSLFSDEFPGCTPLHLTMIHDVDPNLTQLLLDCGANVHARDVYGNTPLHFAAKNSSNLKLFEMIIKAGADINARNSFGETPLDLVLNPCPKSNRIFEEHRSSNIDVTKYFLKKGYRVNSFDPVNQEGWIPLALSKCLCYTTSTSNELKQSEDIYNEIVSAPDLMEIDDLGRTPIHNLASYSDTPTEGIRLLKALLKKGCDIDHQDVIGRSALHIAVQFANIESVTELLKLGADVNVKDSVGKVPFTYCFEASTLIALRRSFNANYSNKEKYKKIVNIFIEHMYKLQFIGLDLCRENLVALENLDHEIVVDCSRLREQLERSKHVRINYPNYSFILHDFLSETKIVTVYPNLLKTNRSYINKFITSNDIDKVCENLDELYCFLKLQYKKAVNRSYIIRNINNCLNVLAKFKVPYTISEMIINHLSNMDLQNLRAAASNELFHEPRSF